MRDASVARLNWPDASEEALWGPILMPTEGGGTTANGESSPPRVVRNQAHDRTEFTAFEEQVIALR